MHSKEVNELDLELAVRSLGLPEQYHIDFGNLEKGIFNLADADGDEIRNYTGLLEELRNMLRIMGCEPTLELTFRIPLTPALEQYLPEMKDRYENWIKFHQAMETGKSPLDDD